MDAAPKESGELNLGDNLMETLYWSVSTTRCRFTINIHIVYIKLKEIKFPIQILLPSEYLFILFQTK